MFLSTDEEFSDFKNHDTLFWEKKGLRYGDWTAGVDGDGSFVKTGSIDTPIVS